MHLRKFGAGLAAGAIVLALGVSGALSASAADGWEFVSNSLSECEAFAAAKGIPTSQLGYGVSARGVIVEYGQPAESAPIGTLAPGDSDGCYFRATAVPADPTVPINLIDAKAKGELVITKYLGNVTGDKANGTEVTGISETSLPGVTFKVCLVQVTSTNDVTDPAWWRAASKMTSAQAAAAVTTTCTTKVTGADGVATFSDLPLGLYYVTEVGGFASVATYLKAPANSGTVDTLRAQVGAPEKCTATSPRNPVGCLTNDEFIDKLVSEIDPINPFVVSIPMTNPAGDAWMYQIFVYPKNDDVTIRKEAETQWVTIGDEVHYRITSDVPLRKNSSKCEADVWSTYLQEFDKYVIKDTLPTNLKIDADSIKLSFKGGMTGFDQDDFIIDLTDGVLTITMTSDGLAKLNGLPNSNGYQIVVEYDSVAVFSGELKNNAELEWNVQNVNAKSDPTLGDPEIKYCDGGGSKRFDDETVYFGGVQIVKSNVAKQGLENACFRVYDNEADAKADNQAKALYFDPTGTGVEYSSTISYCEDNESVTTEAGCDAISGTWVTESKTWYETEEVANFVCTNKDGVAWITGLQYGILAQGQNANTPRTYYVVEYQAPSGYNMLPDIFTITVGGQARTGPVGLDQLGLTCNDANGRDTLICQNQLDQNGNFVRVTNIADDAGFSIPLTGGLGILAWIMAGLVAAGGAVFYLIRARRANAA